MDNREGKLTSVGEDGLKKGKNLAEGFGEWSESEINANCLGLVERVLRKLTEEVSKGEMDRVLEVAGKGKVVFKRFCWEIKRGLVRADREVVDKMKDILMWVVLKEGSQCFLEDFFVFLTVIYDLVWCLKGRDLELDQILDGLIGIVDYIVSNKKSPLINLVYTFEDFRFAEIYKGKMCSFDLVFYLLIGIENLFKLENSKIPEFCRNSMPKVLISILSSLQNSENKMSIQIELAIEKYVSTFRIFHMLCLTNKPEVSREYLKRNSDVITNIFLFSLKNYILLFIQCSSERFENDEGPIGSILKTLLDIMSLSFIGSDQEGFPIIFISVIIQKIQSFALQFLENYLELLSKKKEIPLDFLKEYKIVEILFSVPFFLVKNQIKRGKMNYEKSSNETWNRIWLKFILKDRENLAWIGKAIVQSIRFFGEDTCHLLKINSWVQDRALNDEELISTCIDSGLLEALFYIITHMKRSKYSTKHLPDFFMTIKVLLSQFASVEVPNSNYLVNSMIQDNYITDNTLSDLCLDCLTHLLKHQNDLNYAKFCNLLQQVEDISLKIKIINAIQNVLKENPAKVKCQVGFIKARVLSFLREQLVSSHSDQEEKVITLWVSVLEGVRFLIEDNRFCKENLKEFNFNKIASLIKTSQFAKIRSRIYATSIESLLYVLFETSNLGKPQLRPVKTPEVIPLVVELLTDCEDISNTQEYFDHISICLEDPYNAAHFASRQTTELLLEAFTKSSNPLITNFISSTLPLVICHHISPQDLKKIIETSKTYKNQPEKQAILFKCLASGIKNSCFHTEHFRFGANHTCLAPTQYFGFRLGKSILKCELDSEENLIPNKDFSIFFWFFPDNLSRNSVVLILSGKHGSSLMVSLISGNIVIEYFQEKIIFAVGAAEPVIEKQWNLVGIVFKSISGILKKNAKGEIELFVNYNKVSTETRGKVVRPKEMFSKICIGNTENLGNPFSGKIIAFYIVKKAISLSHFQEVYFLSFQYNLGFNPDAVSTNEEIEADKGTLKYIFDNLVLEWHPRSRYPEVFKGKANVVEECDRFNGISIIESIAANGGLNIFLPLIKDCAEREEERESFILLLQVISDVSFAQSVQLIVNEDFFNILTFILEDSIKKPDVQLVDALINIVGHLEWSPKLYSHSFKSLFLNKRLWKNLDEESNNHYTGTLSLNIKKHFVCEPKVMYGLYDQLSYIQENFCESFFEIWENLIPDLIDNEKIDGILILIFTMIEKNSPLLLRFVGTLNSKKFKKDSIESMSYCLLFLISQLNDGRTQACFLKFLLKLTENYCEEISKEKRNSVNVKDEFEFINMLSVCLDRHLESSILPETFDALILFCLKSIESQEKRKAEKFSNFLNIITKRVKHWENIQYSCERLLIECQNSYFALLIYDRGNFPEWLLQLYELNPDHLNVLSLRIFVSASKSRNFNKLRVFLKTLPSVNSRALSWTLQFYQDFLIHFSFDISKNKLTQFVDCLGILEDILDPNVSIDRDIDFDQYVLLLENIIKISESLGLSLSCYPAIPLINFDTLCSVYRESIVPCLSDVVYLKDGGYLRLILKFIFIGLDLKQDSRLIILLKRTLKGGNLSSEYQFKSEKTAKRDKFDLDSYEKYSNFYISLREKKPDSMNSLKFLSMYIIAECCEVIKRNQPNPILSFLKDFIKETKALHEIEAKTKLTDIELQYFYRLIENNKMMVHSTARSRYKQSERNQNIEQLSQYLAATQYPDSKNFLADFKKVLSLYQIVDCESYLEELLLSDPWISNIHFFFLCSTSMKLNFFSSSFLLDPQKSKKIDPDDYLDKLNKFVEIKQELFSKCKNLYDQKQDRSRRMAEKNYNKFCNKILHLKNILSENESGKFRLKQVVDSFGRMTFIQKKPNFRVASRRSRLSITSLQQMQTLIRNKTLEDIFKLSDSEEEESAISLSNFDDVVRFDCERVKIESTSFGFIEISQDFVLFLSEGKEKPDQELYLGSALEYTTVLKKTEKIWKNSEFSEILPRRFIHRHTAFEIFLRSGKSLYFNLFSEELCKKALDFFKRATRKYGKIVKDPTKLLSSSKRSWQKGQISNLEYLMILNKLSSRSFNDISQYPVFPWVLKDYLSQKLRLDDADVYRNLSFPIGAQTEEGKTLALKKYSGFTDEDFESFHYGSHYSSAAIVLHYMIRLEPFTEMAKQLQEGSFDVADRLFYSIGSSWSSGQGTTGDVKEMIPELFYLPEVLDNINEEEFGKTQDLAEVQGVELPPWAASSVDFVIKHRRALESAYVSSHLHEWIDLIFGCKQKGEMAVTWFNKFNSLTYEDYFKTVWKNSKKKEEIQSLVDQVVHFGQTPMQLLKVPHPAKEVKLKSSDFYEKWKDSHFPEYEVFKSPGRLLSFLSNSQGVLIIKSCQNAVYVTSLKDLTQEKSVPAKLEHVTPLDPELTPCEYFCIWGEEMLVSGLHSDNSFKIHTLKGVLLRSVHHHASLVSCLASDKDLLFSGSVDTSIASWSIFGKDEKIKPYNVYFGHSEGVRQLAVEGSYRILLSLSDRGTVLMHEIQSADCLRKVSQNVKLLSVSSYGLMALHVPGEGVKVLTFNGSELFSKPIKSKIRQIKFSESGDYLIFSTSDEMSFFDILESQVVFERHLDERREGFLVQGFGCSQNREIVAIGFNSEEEFKIWKIK